MNGLLAVSLFFGVIAGRSETWVGRLTIGNTVYSVQSQFTTSSDASVRLSITAARGGSGRTLAAMLTAKGGEFSIDGGQRRPLEPRIAAAWHQQLVNGFRIETTQTSFNCKISKGVGVCDSKGLVSLDESLSGRLRLSYIADRLSAIQFFSLTEWNNPFREFVTLSLDRR